MLLYFDKNGQLLEQLAYGTEPRVGTTNYHIYAFFDVNINIYSQAFIKIKRPDMQESEYPVLYMNKTQITFDKNKVSNSENYSGNFENNKTYTVYDLNFNNIKDTSYDSEGNSTQYTVVLLDTPGKWKASITLTDGFGSSVTGQVKFNVEASAYEIEDEIELSQTTIQNDLKNTLAHKVDKVDGYYIRFWNKGETGDSGHEGLTFEQAANEGKVEKMIFPVGSFVFDPNTDVFYIVTGQFSDSGKSNSDVQDLEYVYVTYDIANTIPEEGFEIGNGKLIARIVHPDNNNVVSTFTEFRANQSTNSDVTWDIPIPQDIQGLGYTTATQEEIDELFE